MINPCPFCGSSDIISTIVDTEDREGTPVALTCTDCGAQGPWSYVPANLIGCKESICMITKWNEREDIKVRDAETWQEIDDACEEILVDHGADTEAGWGARAMRDKMRYLKPKGGER